MGSGESVARDIGPESILPPGSKSITVAEAAGALLKNLQVEVPLNSMVIHASYQHPDPEKARLILGKLVNEYLVKHKETHRSSRSLSYVDTKASEAKTNLETARQELEKLKKEQNIISLANREAALSKQQSAIEDELLATEFKGKKPEIGRFKGLGEMMPAQLKETTMDPGTRTLARVTLPRSEELVEDLVERLMGRKPEARFQFIQENAEFAAADLDI